MKDSDVPNLPQLAYTHEDKSR